jgi:hypothetical protein
MAVSNSSYRPAGIRQKCVEAVTFLRWRDWRPWRSAQPEQFDSIFDDLDEYRDTYERHSGRSFGQARVYEIGYGARPWQLIAMMSMGIDAHGIDLDRPMMGFNPARLARVWRQNGLERALKSGVRSLLFDAGDLRALRAALARRGHAMRVDSSRFHVGDAAAHNFGDRPIDFVYSVAVFEHIPPAGLERIVARLARQLSPNGLMLIAPDVFPGISGGHLLEWYPHLVPSAMARASEPWEHLRKRRYIANTYLNQLPRSAYRDLFRRHFHIVEERVADPDLGRQWLTPEVRADLAGWSEDELFSNRVLFVLGPKK